MQSLSKLLNHSNQLRMSIQLFNKQLILDTSLSYTYIEYSGYSLYSKPFKNKVKMEFQSQVFDIHSYNLNNES